LLLTDVVMPGMNGRVLAERIKQSQPRVKVLFTTGYSGGTALADGGLEAGVVLLSKPFTVEQLASKVRNALEQA
jgi:CheY-like chemotaxis protein